MSENTLPRAAHPEVTALLDELIASGRPSSRTLPLPDGRRNFDELIAPLTEYPEVGPVEDRMIPVDGRDVPVRVYRPDGRARPGASVFLHGGGWVFGDLESHDGLCRSLTSRSRIATVAVDYRRAPEHPFPAAVQDAVGVIRWLADHGGEIGVAARPLAVVGDSSGGNLAAAAALVLRDDGGRSPVAFQALLYPATDPAMDTGSYRENADDPFLSADEMVWYWAQYGGGRAPDDPRAALSAVADLRGLPPAYLMVAGLDPLRDEGLAFADALRRSGVPVTCREYPDMPHGFLLFAGRLSRAVEGLAEVADEIAAGLDGAA
jgi:acetyl esterase